MFLYFDFNVVGIIDNFMIVVLPTYVSITED